MSSLVDSIPKPINDEISVPPLGIVPLTSKLGPVCNRNYNSDEPLAVTRAVVNVSGFKDMLLSLPRHIWDDEDQDGNVQIVRPAHDAWGIKKIIFTFCDDFLQKVLDLPWSQQEKWREHLLPIYEACGIKESQVVRSLLASMPPGCIIPVHHDTGYWVKHTHRLHVAIITDPKVDFFVGPNDTSLQKVVFDEGRIVELNNQAKHAVNNASDIWRVHLIFDYVEAHPITRYILQPGEKVNQTRRSIDLAREAGSRPCPSFIIIGAQKAGTTSVYEYLCQHSLVIKGKRRETHYFDWRWNHSLPHDSAKQHHSYFMNFFDAPTLHKYPSLITGESTPSYLLHFDIVIPRIKMVCPWVKLIVILRDPVARAFSQYNMCVDPNGTPEQLAVRGMSAYIGKSFDDVINEEIEELNTLGITADCTPEHFAKSFLCSRPMNHGGHSIVARGLYSLQLQPWLEAFPPEQIMILFLTDIQHSAPNNNTDVNHSCNENGELKVQTTMERVFAHVGLLPHDLTDIAPKNSRTYEPLKGPTLERLRQFYQPFNRKLETLIGRNVDWV